ncbi:Wadjet anti-phage system protein JetD domain-containing protein [Granulicoccus phenolivorans]|uniref:Wadjet anti-phage system protein JetD domain-containing protein n=1 Tax=Granulicoccus phenolivorans TaxID=266854 RepID=UPI000686F771|nr:Wadjet anti-phage system protein JetD domain-containing protein [Granulicoccus phenolivorans]
MRRLAADRYRRRVREWLGADDLGATEVWSVPLHPPTEATVLADRDRVAGWLSAWRELDGTPGVSVAWAPRRWPAMGSQSVPVRVLLTGAAPVATMAGRSQEWDRLTGFASTLRAAWPAAAYLGDGLRACATTLARLPATELEPLSDVVAWLLQNPHGHLRPREVPVPGVDTKWLERHRRPVESLVAAISGNASSELVAEAQRFRVRVLDNQLLGPGQVRDLTATVAELALWSLSPVRVLIVENLTSLASLPPLHGTVALHGRGYAVTELARIPWVGGSPIDYWGDLDSHGFAILGRCRDRLPHTRSVLMDRVTLRRHAALMVPEPSPYRAAVPGLTVDEAAALALLAEHDLRLEQERLELAYAHLRLRGLPD